MSMSGQSTATHTTGAATAASSVSSGKPRSGESAISTDSEDLQERLDRLRDQYAEAMQELGLANARADKAEADRDRLAKIIAEVRGSLSQVAVYEGILEGSPTGWAVASLVSDHEELEARIDAVMSYLSAGPPVAADEVTREVARLLQGGTRVPDSPEGL